MADGQRRYYLAVRPALLQGALAQFLRATGADVVELDHGDAVIDLRDGAGFDVVVSSPGTGAASPVDARLVIELPDDEGSAGAARLHLDGETHVIDVHGLSDVIDLIERHSTPEAGSGA